MKPIGRFSLISIGRGDFGAAIVRGADAVRRAGRGNAFRGAGGRANGLTMAGGRTTGLPLGVFGHNASIWMEAGSAPSLIVAERLSRGGAHLRRRRRSPACCEAREMLLPCPRIHSRPHIEIRPDRCGLARNDALTAARNAV